MVSADTATATLAKGICSGLFLRFAAVPFRYSRLGVARSGNNQQLWISNASVMLNMALAPLMIFGVGPWRGLGVTGAGSPLSSPSSSQM